MIGNPTKTEDTFSVQDQLFGVFVMSFVSLQFGFKFQFGN